VVLLLIYPLHFHVRSVSLFFLNCYINYYTFNVELIYTQLLYKLFFANSLGCVVEGVAVFVEIGLNEAQLEFLSDVSM
jgi:hypothetical protein